LKTAKCCLNGSGIDEKNVAQMEAGLMKECCLNGSELSFIPDISITPLQVRYYSEALSITALILCQS